MHAFMTVLIAALSSLALTGCEESPTGPSLGQ